MQLDIRPEDLDNLRHMLGVGSHIKQRDWGYRNYYCAPKTGDNYESMRRLEQAGYVNCGRITTDYIYFHATVDGMRAIGMKPGHIKKATSD